MTTDIVKSVSVENMLNQRAAVLDRLEQAFAIIAEAQQLAVAAHVGFPRIEVECMRNGCRYRYDHGDTKGRADNEATMRKVVDRDAWQYLMSESGMRTFMDAQARKTWDESIEKGEFPELTLGNVEATFRLLRDSRGDLFERGVIACFKSLSWDYKTNRPFAFGKRIVLRFARSQTASKDGGTSLGYVNMRTADALDDLARVFHVLDGKPEPDHRTSWYSRLNQCNTTADPDAADDYMSVRSFRNGNGHVTFKRPDLVRKMNAILAKHYPGALAYDRQAA
jgi:hypothetical protein